MTFAIIEAGGKQYKVAPGDKLSIEKIEAPKKGSKIVFDKVLLIDDGSKTTVGDPYIKGAKIEADFVEEGRGKKIQVLKFKSKSRYRVKTGHRQPYTKIAVEDIKK